MRLALIAASPLLLLAAATASAEEEAHQHQTSAFPSTLLQLDGGAEGGSLHIVAPDGTRLVTATTAAGDDWDALADKLIQASREDGVAGSERIAREPEAGAEHVLRVMLEPTYFYVSSEDSGVVLPPTVSEPSATASGSSVDVTWTLPSPAPTSIVILKNGRRATRLHSGATSWTDDGRFEAGPQDPDYAQLTYGIVCYYLMDDEPTVYRVSDVTRTAPIANPRPSP